MLHKHSATFDSVCVLHKPINTCTRFGIHASKSTLLQKKSASNFCCNRVDLQKSAHDFSMLLCAKKHTTSTSFIETRKFLTSLHKNQEISRFATDYLAPHIFQGFWIQVWNGSVLALQDFWLFQGVASWKSGNFSICKSRYFLKKPNWAAKFGQPKYFRDFDLRSEIHLTPFKSQHLTGLMCTRGFYKQIVTCTFVYCSKKSPLLVCGTKKSPLVHVFVCCTHINVLHSNK